jgi:hypothetical protein
MAAVMRESPGTEAAGSTAGSLICDWRCCLIPCRTSGVVTIESKMKARRPLSGGLFDCWGISEIRQREGV